MYVYILGVVKRNPLFLHEIEWKNNEFLFTTPYIYIYHIKIFHFNCEEIISIKYITFPLKYTFNDDFKRKETNAHT